MVKVNRFLVVSLTLICLGFLPLLVNQTIAVSEPLTLSKPELDTHINQLILLYRDQIEAYRSSERKFRLSVTAYEQLKTLTSREEAVSSAAESMVLRGRVLLTYFELLHAKLVESQGVSLADKEIISPQLIVHIERLKNHLVQVEKLTTQQALNEQADQFEPLLESSNLLAKRVLFLLDLGQTRDQLLFGEGYFKEVKEKQLELPLGAIKLAERDRAYQQIEDLFKQINTVLNTLSGQAVSADSEFAEGQNKTRELLNQAQANLLKATNYLRELANQI